MYINIQSIIKCSFSGCLFVDGLCGSDENCFDGNKVIDSN